MGRSKPSLKPGSKSPAQNPTSPASDKSQPISSSQSAWWASIDSKWICLLLAGLVGAVFYPTLQNGFINFDDPLYVTANPQVQNGLNWSGFRWAFTTLEGGFWQPLTWLSYMLDCQIFGLHPGGHHAVDVGLHALNAVLLFLALQRLTGAKCRSAAVAAFFAVHPLHVETVAWVADRKDSLAALFCLGALLTYGRYVKMSRTEDPNRFRVYFLTLGLFLCGLMSKASVAALPLVFLLLDGWPLRRVTGDRWRVADIRRLVLEKLPFLALGLAIGLIGVHGQKYIEAVPGFSDFPISDRIQNAILSYGYYVIQTFWPVNLAGYYPYPRSFSGWKVTGFTLAELAITVVVLRAWRTRSYLAVGWMWYGLTMLPAIGLLQIGGHSRADRYTYLPLIGIFILLVWGLHDFMQRRRQISFFTGMMLVALFACSALTRRQTGYWHDAETFWNHTLAITKDNMLAQYNLGVELGKQDRLDEAMLHLQEALRLKPDYTDAHNSLGAILGKQGRFDEAIDHLQTAIKLKPKDAEAHGNLADALLLKGQAIDAANEYQTAIQLNPKDPDFHIKLARLLGMSEQYNDAVIHFREAIRLAPRSADAHAGLGLMLFKQEHFEESIAELRAALERDAASVEARCNLGIALCRTGHLDEGITQLQEALRLNPDYADARANLEIAFRLKAGGQTP